MDLFAPYLWILAAAAVMGVAGLSMVLGRGGSDRRGRPRLRPVRRLFGLLVVALAAVCALLAMSVYQFVRLTGDEPVARLELRQLADGHYLAALSREGAAAPQQFDLRGDQWQIDAQVVRWRLPALLAGVPPLYRLERLSGRYDDIERERSAPRTAHDLGASPVPGPGALKRRYPAWLPFVDVVYGSGAYMPMFDGARYLVLLDPRGALFIRPADEATAQALAGRQSP